MKLIERTSYLEKLKKLRGTPDIKIITGMRRVGKSKMMEAYLADGGFDGKYFPEHNGSGQNRG